MLVKIFGIAGVAGNGQNELLMALSGETPSLNAETIKLDGKSVADQNILRRRKHGLCAVPEERNGHAAVVDFSLSDNAILTARDRMNLSNNGMIKHAEARKYTKDVISTFGVKTTGDASPAGSLSGGNLQKFVVGREIMQKPDVLLISQPTWGVDAGGCCSHSPSHRRLS